MTQQSVTILGATGSIGLNSLRVLELHPELFRLFALTANTNKEKLLELCLCYVPQFAVLANEQDGVWLRSQLPNNIQTQVLTGSHALSLVASEPDVDIVISAIVGSVGALPTFSAAKAGKKILLANKETLVMAGDLFYQVVDANQAIVLPVDSEHNAIFQVFPENVEQVKQIILTASGGPFLHKPLAELEQVSVEEALKHPNWSMGPKISIDSATMMNKALEVIEAAWLFKLPADKIDVIIHPESVIHSMVQFVDESILAQMGVADMKIPIEYCLAYPDRISSGASPLDIVNMPALQFMKVDKAKFPALNLAYEVLESGMDAGCILNAANEVAVDLFLQNKIKFTHIYTVVSEVLDSIELELHSSLETLLLKDTKVRHKTQEIALKYFN